MNGKVLKKIEISLNSYSRIGGALLFKAVQGFGNTRSTFTLENGLVIKVDASDQKRLFKAIDYRIRMEVPESLALVAKTNNDVIKSSGWKVIKSGFCYSKETSSVLSENDLEFNLYIIFQCLTFWLGVNENELGVLVITEDDESELDVEVLREVKTSMVSRGPHQDRSQPDRVEIKISTQSETSKNKSDPSEDIVKNKIYRNVPNENKTYLTSEQSLSNSDSNILNANRIIHPEARSFASSFWRGEYPLPFSYWIVCVFGSLLFYISLLGTASLIYATFPDISRFATAVSLLFIYAIYVFWSTIGLWRSASNYIKKHRGLRLFWAYVTKIIILLQIIPGLMAVFGILFAS